MKAWVSIRLSRRFFYPEISDKLNPDLLARIAIVLFAGGFIQSSAGFGFGLFALPLLLFLKLKLPEAVIIVVIGSAIQKIMGIGYFRKVINLKEISPLIISGMTGLPIGLYLMFRVSGMHISSIKQVIGFLIIFMLLLRWLKLTGYVINIKSIWTYSAGFLSGILNGFANIGGPPVILWVLAQNWNNRKMRATIISFSLFFVPFQIIIMLAIFGRTLYSPIFFSLLLSPAVLFGSWIGLKFGDRFSKRILEKYMELLLLLIALASVLRPVFN